MRWMLALMLVIGTLSPVEAEMYNGNETPDYTVEVTDGAFEIRQYPPHIAAEVTVSGSRDAAINAGFRVLAGYIFGGNEAKAKVAMTTPVTQAPSEKIAMTTPVTQTGSDHGWTVQFMMPAAYTLDTLPKPNDSRIRLVTTKPVRMVVLRFSGIPTTASLASRTEELRAWAKAKGLATTGEPQFMFYDAPFKLPWKRRNEVAFRLE
ncbi:heme-binding protein [Tabrizicola sp.]|uniref:SOUL family heme-binding protein n=1 Tax=Tabrizicola sp. TaxID=2005166 RepID=UPI00286A7638|nr:heme-binding protein [Tabrizicola sp.]